jgi:hypothetical protein
VNPKMLSSDRSLGLNKMLDYVRLLKLDMTPSFPMNHLVEIQKNRNAAIHAGLQVAGHREFSKSDLECFEHVIRHFGI